MVRKFIGNLDSESPIYEDACKNIVDKSLIVYSNKIRSVLKPSAEYIITLTEITGVDELVSLIVFSEYYDASVMDFHINGKSQKVPENAYDSGDLIFTDKYNNELEFIIILRCVGGSNAPNRGYSSTKFIWDKSYDFTDYSYEAFRPVLRYLPEDLTSEGLLSTWVDSGYSPSLVRDAIQNTDMNKPSVVSNVLNGYPILRFSGDNYLDISNAASVTRQNKYSNIFAVVRCTNIITSPQYIILFKDNSDGIRFALGIELGKWKIWGKFLDSESTNSLTYGDVILNEWVIIHAKIADSIADTKYIIRLNGIETLRTATRNTTTGISNTDSTAVRIGCRDPGDGHFIGDIAEIRFSQEFTTTEHRWEDARAAKKYNLESLLPTNYPWYKTTYKKLRQNMFSTVEIII